MSNTTDDDQETSSDVELFWKVMSADGPVVTSSPDLLRRAVAITASKFDGNLTNPTLRSAVDRNRRYVWFHSEEADIVLEVWADEADRAIKAIEAMPYEVEESTMSDIVAASLRWGEAKRL